MELKRLALLFLFQITQAINPFEGNFPRYACLTGRKNLEGCNTTFLEEYEKSGLPKLEKPDNTVNDPDTWFPLFTRKNPENPELLDKCGGSLPKNSYYNCTQTAIFIIHGYSQGVCHAAWYLEMKDQLLWRGNYNVLIVDYSWGNQHDYAVSIGTGFIVGKQIAFVICNLERICGQPIRTRLIGQSLGGQVAGIVGHFVKVLCNKTIDIIDALDPAGPGFMDSPANERLDKSDAKCVHVIHTGAGKCLPWYGNPHPLGHKDFYVNGGSVQLSCIPYILYSFLKSDTSYGASCLMPTTCFHKQGVQYFKASINACGCYFIGVECPSWKDFQSGKCGSCGTDGEKCEIMGMDTECEPSGGDDKNHTYFLKTRLECPYCDNSAIEHENFSEPTTKYCFNYVPSQ